MGALPPIETLRSLLKNFIAKKEDAFSLEVKLSKIYSLEDRAKIVDYALLLEKAKRKFGECDFLLFDKLALEQATAKDLAQAKSSLWPKRGRIHDLCCGMGGDSFFIPEGLEILGVDQSEERLEMYRHNMKVFNREAKTFLGDCREWGKSYLSHIAVCNEGDFFTIDPARRKVENDNQRILSELTPSFDEVVEMAKFYRGGMAKLPPAFPKESIPPKAELVYLGSHADCREALVLFGELARFPDKTSAMMIDKNGKILAEWTSEKKRSEENFILPEGSLKTYLSEPAPILVRSGLFVLIARKFQANLLSENIAYVTSDTPLPSPAFRNFKIESTCALTTSAVKKMLKENDIGFLDLKKRGVEIEPEKEIKRLSPKGKRRAILFYTRIAGEKSAILAQEILHSDASISPKKFSNPNLISEKK